jgi:hypothetical protein
VGLQRLIFYLTAQNTLRYAAAHFNEFVFAGHIVVIVSILAAPHLCFAATGVADFHGNNAIVGSSTIDTHIDSH